MQTTMGDGRWAGVWHAEQNGGLARGLSATTFFVPKPFVSIFFDLGECVEGNFPRGRGQMAALVDMSLPRLCGGDH